MKYNRLKNFVRTSDVLTNQAKKSLTKMLEPDFDAICSHGATSWHIEVIGCLNMFGVKFEALISGGSWVVKITDPELIREFYQEGVTIEKYKHAIEVLESAGINELNDAKRNDLIAAAAALKVKSLLENDPY